MLNEVNVLNLIQDWVNRGLVAPEHQSLLVTDVRRLQYGSAPAAKAERSPSIRRINPLAVTIAVVCGLLGLALLAQLAANWQDIPRLVRVLLLCSGIGVLHGGAGWRLNRAGTDDAAMHGLACLGTVMYGAALFLVSQMFHLGGTAAEWLLLWLIGAFLTALAFSSRPVLVLSVVLAGLWGGCLIFPQGLGESPAPLADYIWQYPAVLLLLLIPTQRWHCTTARVLLIVLGCLWGLVVFGQVIVTWADLSKGMRLILLLTVLLAIYGWMVWLLRKAGAVTTKVLAFAVLGNVFYGLVLAIVGKMFTLGGTVPDWLLLWWTGVFAMTLALSSRVLLFFTLILIGCLGQYLWLGIGPATASAPIQTIHLWLFAVTIVLFAGAAWRLRSRIGQNSDEIHGILVALFYGMILLVGMKLQTLSFVQTDRDAVLGWLLVWLIGSYLIALIVSSRVTLGLAMLLAGLWAGHLMIWDGELQPFVTYGGQLLPVLLLLLLPTLRWKNAGLILLWQILLLGWFDLLLGLSDWGGNDALIPFRVGGLMLVHLVAAMAVQFLPDRWDWLKPVTLRFNFWIAIGLTFVYALANSLDHGRILARIVQDVPTVMTGVLAFGVAVVICGLVLLWRKQHLSRVKAALWSLSLLFSVVLIFNPTLQQMVSMNTMHNSAAVYSWLTAILVLGLVIVLLLGEAVKNRRSTMVLCSLLLILTCISLYVAWTFTESALLFLMVGLGLLAGMKMVRRVRG